MAISKGGLSESSKKARAARISKQKTDKEERKSKKKRSAREAAVRKAEKTIEFKEQVKKSGLTAEQLSKSKEAFISGMDITTVEQFKGGVRDVKTVYDPYGGISVQETKRRTENKRSLGREVPTQKPTVTETQTKGTTTLSEGGRVSNIQKAPMRTIVPDIASRVGQTTTRPTKVATEKYITEQVRAGIKPRYGPQQQIGRDLSQVKETSTQILQENTTLLNLDRQIQALETAKRLQGVTAGEVRTDIRTPQAALLAQKEREIKSLMQKEDIKTAGTIAAAALTGGFLGAVATAAPAAGTAFQIVGFATAPIFAGTQISAFQKEIKAGATFAATQRAFRIGGATLAGAVGFKIGQKVDTKALSQKALEIGGKFFDRVATYEPKIITYTKGFGKAGKIGGRTARQRGGRSSKVQISKQARQQYFDPKRGLTKGGAEVLKTSKGTKEVTRLLKTREGILKQKAFVSETRIAGKAGGKLRKVEVFERKLGGATKFKGEATRIIPKGPSKTISTRKLYSRPASQVTTKKYATEVGVGPSKQIQIQTTKQISLKGQKRVPRPKEQKIVQQFQTQASGDLVTKTQVGKVQTFGPTTKRLSGRERVQAELRARLKAKSLESKLKGRIDLTKEKLEPSGTFFKQFDAKTKTTVTLKTTRVTPKTEEKVAIKTGKIIRDKFLVDTRYRGKTNTTITQIAKTRPKITPTSKVSLDSKYKSSVGIKSKVDTDISQISTTRDLFAVIPAFDLDSSKATRSKVTPDFIVGERDEVKSKPVQKIEQIQKVRITKEVLGKPDRSRGFGGFTPYTKTGGQGTTYKQYEYTPESPRTTPRSKPTDPPPLTGFGLPKNDLPEAGGKQTKRKKSEYDISRDFAYTPTVFAGVLKIKGKGKAKGGLGLRPIKNG